MLDTFIKELSQELELTEPLVADVPGVYALPLDEGLSIMISANSNNRGMQLACTLGPAPMNKEEDFFTQAMLGNLFGQGTKNGVLGLSEDGKMMTLSRTIYYDIDYRQFREIVEDFINSVDFWREEALNY